MTASAVAICVTCWIAASSLAADQLRPFSVDDLLLTERFGRVMFDTEGNNLYYEHHRPFGIQPGFGRFDFYRPQLFTAASGSWDQPLPLIENQVDGFHMLGVSPGGDWIAYRRAAIGGEYVGVTHLEDGRQVEFDNPPEYFMDAVWLDKTIVYPARPEGEPRYVYAMRVEHIQELKDRWRVARKGHASTASVLKSGPGTNVDPGDEFLVRANPDSGRTQIVAKGRFGNLQSSPDGRKLAMLHEVLMPPDADRLIEHGINIGGTTRRLAITEIARSETPARGLPIRYPCQNCDVLPDSLRWSPCGQYLAFVARKTGTEWITAVHFVYNHKTGQTRPVGMDELTPHILPDPARETLSLPAAWVGDRLAILASAPGKAASRPDWYLLGSEGPVNLTEEFPGLIPELVVVLETGAVFLHSGALWVVDTSGSRQVLVIHEKEPLEVWHGQRGLLKAQGDLPTLVLQVRSSEADSKLLLVNIASGEIRFIRSDLQHARFVAVAPESGRATTISANGNATVLSIVDTSGESVQVAEINAHLNRVVGGLPMRIDHEGPDGSPRISWLLLPPGYKNDQPLPTVVNLYPGRVGGEEFRFRSIDQTSALNDHLLAAHGYAVLFPSLPVIPQEGFRNPLEGLEEEVFSAINAAASMGLVAVDRLAVQGQSHGGFAAAGMIGQSDRFRAAVASAGIYNLISFYGTFDPRAWHESERRGIRMFGASWLETGTGGIGAPPWRDPERYLANSPLMQVENVTTPIMLIHGDRDFVSITQAEEYFTALTRLNRKAVFVRYIGEGHVVNSPANIRDMWTRIHEWYDEHIGPPYPVHGRKPL